MAVSNYHRLQYGKAGADLSKAHGQFVKLGSDGRYVPTAASTDAMVGVVIIGVEENFELGICMERGVLVPAMASGAIGVGQKVMYGADGKIAVASSGNYIGICQEAAAADGDIVTIIFLGLVPGA